MSHFDDDRPGARKSSYDHFARFPIRAFRDAKEYDDAVQVLDELAVRDERTLSGDEQD